ncbi:MAG: hypothetical protein B6I31_00605 [Desulfobacteraceae bacterium 4572_19]|nr:MAG: hypothetical protein B6I31_00605 [Desulfobacteraceae bacterium 4572_19]
METTATLPDIKPVSELRRKIIEKLKDSSERTDEDNAVIEFLEGNPLLFIETIHGINIKEEKHKIALKSNMDQLALRLNIMLILNKTKERTTRLLEGSISNYDKKTQSFAKDHFNHLFDTANALLSNDPKPYNESIIRAKNPNQHLKQIGEKLFSHLDKDELEQVHSIIKKLVRKLKEIVLLRYAKKNKGVLDLKRTLRRSAAYYGVPVELKFKDKPPGKGKIVVLCDVSGSVWSASRFMLTILYSLQECFSRVNSFIFVAMPIDVTSFFTNHDVNEALEMILSNADINLDEATDYGETLRGFKQNYLNILDRKTTLIIIGDARSNYLNPQEAILNEMRRKCRRVVWLNPETENSWNTGDSEVSSYMPYCHEFRQCTNLNQLIDFIEELV